MADKTDGARAGRRNLRAALVEGAVAQVAARGADGLMVAELARDLGISTAAPYRHFADRTALLHAVAAVGMDRLAAALADAAATADRAGPLRIVAIGRAYLDFAAANPLLFGAMFDAGPPRTPTPDALRLDEAGQAAFGVLLHHVAAATGATMPSPHARRLAFALWSYVHGQAMLDLVGAGRSVGAGVDRDALMIDMAAAMLRAGQG
jgi:AcrR family transcriptional regulator